MTQLIINGITLPETSGDKYQCYPAELGTQLDMISGRRVSEIRGNVQKIHYEYDYLGDAVWRPLAAALRSGAPMTVQYLPDDGSSRWTECDIDTLGAKSRGAKRIVFSDDGLIYYTGDHYQSFELLYGEE